MELPVWQVLKDAEEGLYMDGRGLDTAMVVGCYRLLVEYNAEHADDGQLA